MATRKPTKKQPRLTLERAWEYLNTESTQHDREILELKGALNVGLRRVTAIEDSVMEAINALANEQAIIKERMDKQRERSTKVGQRVTRLEQRAQLYDTFLDDVKRLPELRATEIMNSGRVIAALDGLEKHERVIESLQKRFASLWIDVEKLRNPWVMFWSWFTTPRGQTSKAKKNVLHRVNVPNFGFYLRNWRAQKALDGDPVITDLMNTAPTIEEVDQGRALYRKNLEELRAVQNARQPVGAVYKTINVPVPAGSQAFDTNDCCL